MNPKNSQDLFNKIRSQFSNIRLGDENGAATADPGSAVFFEFEFQEDADTFGSVSISLADGENMKVYYNRDLVSKIDEDSRDEWYAFLKELKDFAVEHQMRFDVRDITKNNLTKQDYENLADTNKTVNTDEMSEELNRITKLAGVEKAPVAEGLSGTSKSSFENLNKTKLIIRHKGKVDETVPGARSRQIQSLYIENEDGERFKYPMTHLAGARAMQRHVSNGGRPHDEFGQHIVSTSEDIAKLNSFSRYVTNKDQLNDNAGDIIEQTKLKLENLRGYMKNIAKQSHYEAASKDFKTADEQVLDDETVNKMREKFTMTNLDSRVEDALPIINRIMSELEAPKEEEQVNELDPGDEPIDAPIQAPVDHGAVVQSFLTDPENKLVLRKDPTADKMLSATKFTDKNTMLGSILSDIASRLLTKSGEEDRVANFASRVADGIEQEGSNSFKPGPDYNSNKKIAVQLAKRYIDDYKKMQQDPAYADEVRMDPADFSPKKNIKGKAIGKETEAFESWVDETVNEYAKPIDLTNKGMFKTPGDDEEKKLDVTKADKMIGSPAYQKMKAGDPKYKDKTENQLEGLTFEDIKPYVSMYTDKDGKKVNAVLDKDGAEVFKTHDAKAAMAYLSQNYDKLKKEDAEDDRIEKAMKDMQPSAVTGYYEIKAFWEEHTQGLGKSDDEVMHMIYEWTWDEIGYSGSQERDELAKRTSAIVTDALKNNKDDMTFDDMIDQIKGKSEDNAPDMVVRDPDDEAEDKEQEIAKDQEEAEEINTELDRIKQLANI